MPITQKSLTSRPGFVTMSGRVVTDFYGYFSPKQHAVGCRLKHCERNNRGDLEYTSKNGYNIWLTDDGREVKTSEVIRVRDDARMKSMWNDTQYVGHIVKWLRFEKCDYPPLLFPSIVEKFPNKKINNENFNEMFVAPNEVILPDLNPDVLPVGSGISAVRLRNKKIKK